MKKTIRVTLLILALLMMLSGCGKQNDTFKNDSIENDPVETDNTEAETVEVKIPGTWQTASMMLGDDGDVSPEHYVQFTDSSINYGHMKDGEFVPDYSDQISRLEENAAGGFSVQAEAANGVQYTYQTSENDNDILEYYETWQEDEFPEMYRGGASLSKCS